MCGRYVTISKVESIEKRFKITIPEPKKHVPNPNLGPGQTGLVITQEDPQTGQFFSFGLTPFWGKKRMYLFNARSEGDLNKENDPQFSGAKGIIKKPAFRKPIRSQRCLIVADAFIEGPEKEKLCKPYLVYLKNNQRPFAFAGIYDQWVDKDTGEIFNGYSIITTTANRVLQKVGHHRSPVILKPEDESTWLDAEAPLNEITSLLKPYPADEMNAYPISPDIKNPRNHDMSLLQPVGQRVEKEYDYSVEEMLQLWGMGESSARQRRKDE
jgi:putative SOS response-associated peptidase YedK